MAASQMHAIDKMDRTSSDGKNDVLPRLCYVGSLSVERTSAGSMQLYRLLKLVPADRLRITELDCSTSAADRRLEGVKYMSARFRTPRGWRFARRRWHALFAVMLGMRSWFIARKLAGKLRSFEPEAIITLHEGFGWLSAAALAKRLRVPLHLVLHDDWFRHAAQKGAGTKVERIFGDVYRSAASRFCISSEMADEYSERFGARGAVVYPIRDESGTLAKGGPPRRAATVDLVIGYAGNLFTEGYWDTLRDLADALSSVGGTLRLFGPMQMADLERAGLVRPYVQLCGFAEDVIDALRTNTDVAFVPMTFEREMAVNMRLSFPSKVADYTGAGLPLLVYGPPYCSAVRWAEKYGAAEIVKEKGAEPLREALLRLSDEAHREKLRQRSAEAGDRFFSAAAAQEVLYAALRRQLRPC